MARNIPQMFSKSSLMHARRPDADRRVASVPPTRRWGTRAGWWLWGDDMGRPVTDDHEVERAHHRLDRVRSWVCELELVRAQMGGSVLALLRHHAVYRRSV
jgi:hypothetical protein